MADIPRQFIPGWQTWSYKIVNIQLRCCLPNRSLSRRVDESIDRFGSWNGWVELSNTRRLCLFATRSPNESITGRKLNLRPTLERNLPPRYGATWQDRWWLLLFKCYYLLCYICKIIFVKIPIEIYMRWQVHRTCRFYFSFFCKP